MGQKTSAILKRARRLISRPSRWTRNALARDPIGNICDYDFGGATCFCAEGAIYRAAGSLEAGDPVIEFLRRQLKRPAVWVWNDAKGRKHSDILAGFDLAIKRAEERELATRSRKGEAE